MRNSFLLMSIYFLCFSFSLINAQTETKYGEVSYISSNNIYVRFDGTQGIQKGDTLYLNRDGNNIPVVKVEFLSTSSAAGTPLTNEKIRKGDSLFAYVQSTKQVKETVDSLVVEETTEKSQPKVQTEKTEVPSETSVGGKFSLASYSNLSSLSGRNDYQRWRYRFSFNADNLLVEGLSIQTYSTFSYRADEWNRVSGNISEAARIYDLSAEYSINENNYIAVGRNLNRHISNIGALDGVQYHSKFGNFFGGAVVGSRPDYKNYGYNFNLFEYGGYLGRKDRVLDGYMESTLSIFQQTRDFKTDRRFMYFQHTNTIVDDIRLFLSTEMDLYKRENGNDKNTLRLTSLYISTRYSPLNWFSISTSYDARKNVIYYETYKSYTDSLLENAMRQGFRVRARFKPMRYVYLNLRYGYRYRESDVKPTNNYGGSLTYSRIPLVNISATASFNSLNTSYVDGAIYSLRLRRAIVSGKLDGTIGYKKINYNFLSSNYSMNQDVLLLNLSWQIVDDISLNINYEGTFEKQRNYSRIYTNITTRF